MSVRATCPRCGGAQYDPEDQVEVTCLVCGGRGDFGPSPLPEAEGMIDYCQHCGGRGRRPEPAPCRSCGGYGEVESPDENA